VTVLSQYHNTLRTGYLVAYPTCCSWPLRKSSIFTKRENS